MAPPAPLIDGRIGRTPIRYRVPANNNLGIMWTAPAFDDRAWTPGLQGVGYEDAPAEYEPLLSEAVDPADIYPGATSLQVRLPFVVANPAVVGLTLRMKYDDGYVAWLNGVEVARRNVPAGAPSWNGRAISRPDAQAIVYQDVDIQAFANRLVVGANVLAVHVMNVDPNSSDMLMNVELIHR